jgi:hypothetical protein
MALVESLDPRPRFVVRSTLSRAEVLARFASAGLAPVVVVPRSASLRELVWAVRRAVAKSA